MVTAVVSSQRDSAQEEGWEPASGREAGAAAGETFRGTGRRSRRASVSASLGGRARVLMGDPLPLGREPAETEEPA